VLSLSVDPLCALSVMDSLTHPFAPPQISFPPIVFPSSAEYAPIKSNSTPLAFAKDSSLNAPIAGFSVNSSEHEAITSARDK